MLFNGDFSMHRFPGGGGEMSQKVPKWAPKVCFIKYYIKTSAIVIYFSIFYYCCLSKISNDA